MWKSLCCSWGRGSCQTCTQGRFIHLRLQKDPLEAALGTNGVRDPGAHIQGVLDAQGGIEVVLRWPLLEARTAGAAVSVSAEWQSWAPRLTDLSPLGLPVCHHLSPRFQGRDRDSLVNSCILGVGNQA
jgi:hypothetical protein